MIMTSGITNSYSIIFLGLVSVLAIIFYTFFKPELQLSNKNKEPLMRYLRQNLSIINHSSSLYAVSQIIYSVRYYPHLQLI